MLVMFRMALSSLRIAPPSSPPVLSMNRLEVIVTVPPSLMSAPGVSSVSV